jgi:hypothetical protein
MNQVPQIEPVEPAERTVVTLAGSAAWYAGALAVMLISPLLVFIPAVIFHCATRNGRTHGQFVAWVSLLGGAALAGAGAVWISRRPPVGPHDLAMNSGSLLTLVLGIGLPSLLVLPMVRRGVSFGRVLLTAVFLGLLGLAATEVIIQQASGVSLYATQVTAAKEMAAGFMGANAKGFPADVPRFMRLWKELLVYCLPAILLIDVCVVFVLSLVMFGRLGRWPEIIDTRGLSEEEAPYLFRNFSLPEWLLFAFIIGGISPLLSGMPQRITANVLMMVAFLYLLQGLAIFRSLLVSMDANFGVVLFAYAALALLTMVGVAPLLLSIAGLFDSFFDFRHFNRKDSTHEGHSD